MQKQTGNTKHQTPAILECVRLYTREVVTQILEEVSVKTFGSSLLLVLLTAGCATTSTVESRKLERHSSYAGLSPEQRALVDQGHIKVGLPSDAVYIAWGAPSQVLNGESAAGTTTTWIYSGTGWQERGYWTYHNYGYGYVHPLPTYDYEYIPYRYTAAEVVFQNDVVKSWKHITPPPH
jgi:hypothetical protein